MASACQPPSELRTTSTPAPRALPVTVTHREQLPFSRPEAAPVLTAMTSLLAVIEMVRLPGGDGT
jgi:hypothetical protein